MHLDDKHHPIWHSDARRHLLINSRFTRLLFLCNSDGGHGDRSTGLVVPISRSSRDFHDDIHALDNLAEDRVLGRSLAVKPVKEVVVNLRGVRYLVKESSSWNGMNPHTVFTKNWEPPLFGWPVFAMERVPGSFEIL